jgi:hypothetical protein
MSDDLNEIENFKESKNNSFLNELLIGNQNDIGQILILISQQFNKINTNNLNNILSSKFRIKINKTNSLLNR